MLNHDNRSHKSIHAKMIFTHVSTQITSYIYLYYIWASSLESFKIWFFILFVSLYYIFLSVLFLTLHVHCISTHLVFIQSDGVLKCVFNPPGIFKSNFHSIDMFDAGIDDTTFSFIWSVKKLRNKNLAATLHINMYLFEFVHISLSQK